MANVQVRVSYVNGCYWKELTRRCGDTGQEQRELLVNGWNFRKSAGSRLDRIGPSELGSDIETKKCRVGNRITTDEASSFRTEIQMRLRGRTCRINDGSVAGENAPGRVPVLSYSWQCAVVPVSAAVQLLEV